MSIHAVRANVDKALRPGCFFVASPGRLRIVHVDREELGWEIFRGHLLDSVHARQQGQFEAWNVFLDVEQAAPGPLISVKWQADRQQLHVTRQILTHGFEAYEDEPGVILSRPKNKWVTELVGTIVADRWDDARADELGVYLFLAVIGTSRLPITSLESPLPAFSLGQLAYLPRRSAGDEPWTDPVVFLQAALAGQRTTIERAKALETALRATPAAPVAALAEAIATTASLPGLFRALFNHAALSPYTEFAPRMIALLLELAAAGSLDVGVVVDVLSYMLRHLCRHLTAFDLTLFHNFGANYPDALFLDSLLRTYLRLIDAHPDLFSSTTDDTTAVARQKTVRRRALRQAVIARQQYEGHRVPDAPTSLGENARVLPDPFVRVPEEQILDRSQRSRRLFEGEPLEGLLSETGRRVLVASLSDLAQPAELAELGMAQFLDRPLGVCKEPGAVDRTPLLSYEAFSRAIVKRRLSQLKFARWLTAEQRETFVAALGNLSIVGIDAAGLAPRERPGVVSLADARKVAADFVFLRTTRGSLKELLTAYDWEPLARVADDTVRWLKSAAQMLWVQGAPMGQPSERATLMAYDEQGRLRLQLGFAAEADKMVHYRERRGVEFVDRLQILQVAEVGEPAKLRDLREQSMWIELRGNKEFWP